MSSFNTLRHVGACVLFQYGQDSASVDRIINEEQLRQEIDPTPFEIVTTKVTELKMLPHTLRKPLILSVTIYNLNIIAVFKVLSSLTYAFSIGFPPSFD